MKEIGIDSDSDDGFEIDYVFDDEKEEEERKGKDEQQAFNRMSDCRNRITIKNRINR